VKTEMWAIGRVKPYERNPRKNEGAIDAVAKSIAEFGFRVPIVVDRAGVVIAGHTRLKAAEKLGLKEVPVHVARELSPEQVKALRIADNQVATLSKWDMELLPLELADLQGADFDLSVLGFGEKDLATLLAPPDDAGLADPDEVPPPRKEPISKPGDIWTLGDHRLMCGDSRSADHVALVMNGELADLVATDPPYGVEYVGKTKGALVIENDSIEGLPELLRDSLGHALKVSRPGTVWYVAAPAGPQFAAFAQVLGDLGIWRQTLAWVKDSMVLGHSDYHYRHEAILYGWAPGPGHQVPPVRSKTSVLEFPRPKASPDHPTMKPVALWAELIANSTEHGGLLYEPFGGSGTSIIAAERLGRRCRAIELDPRYVDVCVARWEKYTGRKAQRLGPRPRRRARSKKAPAKAGA
jgi:DNA modification methylase